MDAEELQELIQELVYDHGQQEGVQIDVTTYEDSDLLTRDAGLAIDLPDGTQFQLTIVRSR